ncbi:DUF1572 family protein [Alicyclobacillus sp. ALC3]|nr:DUF1572 family protein [Alicyclobacillus sp. ALC3]
MYHLSNHTGQFVYLTKQIRGADWETLPIPGGN